VRPTGAADKGLELANGLLERDRLGTELFGCGGVRLGDLVHLADSGVDLADAVVLLMGGRGDFGDRLDDFCDIVGGILDGIHGLAHLVHVVVAGIGSIALRHRGKLFERRTGLLEAGGLFAGAFGEGLAGGRSDLRGAVAEGGGEPVRGRGSAR